MGRRPDQDVNSYGSYYTYNDTVDVDEDGVGDLVQSEGYYTGYTVAFGACDPDNSELGHYPRSMPATTPT